MREIKWCRHQVGFVLAVGRIQPMLDLFEIGSMLDHPSSSIHYEVKMSLPIFSLCRISLIVMCWDAIPEVQGSIPVFALSFLSR